MRLLKTIADGDTNNYTIMEYSARGVMLNDENKIPILFVSKYNYHKLPGGGIEQSESKYEALKREITEETGCKIEIQGEVGEIALYFTRFKVEQHSYCYFGKIIKKGIPQFTKEEIEEGFELQWYKLSEALEVLKNDNPDNYEGSLIQRRDIEFLKEAKELFN